MVLHPLWQRAIIILLTNQCPKRTRIFFENLFQERQISGITLLILSLLGVIFTFTFWCLNEACLCFLREVDLVSILTKVNADVSKKSGPYGWKKQMPQPAFSLRKKVIFPVPKTPPPLVWAVRLLDLYERCYTYCLHIYNVSMFYTSLFFINFLKDLPKFSTFTLHLVFLIDFQYMQIIHLL